MYEIEFYEKENGESDVWNFLEELREKSNSSKDSRRYLGAETRK